MFKVVVRFLFLIFLQNTFAFDSTSIVLYFNNEEVFTWLKNYPSSFPKLEDGQVQEKWTYGNSGCEVTNVFFTRSNNDNPYKGQDFLLIFPIKYTLQDVLKKLYDQCS